MQDGKIVMAIFGYSVVSIMAYCTTIYGDTTLTPIIGHGWTEIILLTCQVFMEENVQLLQPLDREHDLKTEYDLLAQPKTFGCSAEQTIIPFHRNGMTCGYIKFQQISGYG